MPLTEDPIRLFAGRIKEDCFGHNNGLLCMTPGVAFAFGHSRDEVKESADLTIRRDGDLHGLFKDV